MKELRFFSVFWLHQAAAMLSFAAVVGIGLLVTRNPENLFGVYARMFPVFVLIFPAVLTLSGRSVRDVALTFGAKRMKCYAVRELLGTMLLVLLLAAAAVLDKLLLLVPDGGEHTFGLTAGGAVLIFMFAFAAQQTAFLLEQVKGGKARGILLGVLMAALMGGGMMAYLLIGSRFGQSKSIEMGIGNPFLVGAVLLAAVAAAVMAAAAAFAERKAVVSV